MASDSDRPTSGKGADLGAGGEPSSFEPEEDTEAVARPDLAEPDLGGRRGHVRTDAETGVDDALGGEDDPSR
jgi:hypothetical protein